jgi:hypothetical protein
VEAGADQGAEADFGQDCSGRCSSIAWAAVVEGEATGAEGSAGVVEAEGLGDLAAAVRAAAERAEAGREMRGARWVRKN